MNSNIPRFSVLILCAVLFSSGCLNRNDGCNFEPNLSANQQQLADDIDAINTFLNNNQITAQQDPSGLRYVINNPGTGANANFCSDVVVTFRGTLFDGSEFDSADEMNPASFNLRSLIVGWQIGIPLVKEGGSITLYIPSVFAFGNQPAPGIPPNSSVIFEIGVLSVD